MSTDGTIRLPDGTVVPLVLPGEGAEPEPEPEPGGWPEEISLPLLTDEQWDALDLGQPADIVYSYKDTEDIKEGVLLGLASLRDRLAAEQQAEDDLITFPINRDGLPTVGELLAIPENVARREVQRREQEWVAERLMAELRTDVNLMELQESIAKAVWGGFRQGALVGAAATLGLGLAWAIADRMWSSWRS